MRQITKEFTISFKIPAKFTSTILQSDGKEAGNWKRDPSRRSRTGRFDIEPYERMSIIWKIVISRLFGSPGPFVSRICIHTPMHAHARTHRPLLRGRGRTMQFARAISGHSSPFSASHEWHGNRLSITHAHSRDRDTWRGTPSVRTSSRVEAANACDDARPRQREGGGGGWGGGWGSAAGETQPPCVVVTCRSEERRSRMRGRGGDLRLLSLSKERPSSPRVTHDENYVADDPSTGNFRD